MFGFKFLLTHMGQGLPFIFSQILEINIQRAYLLQSEGEKRKVTKMFSSLLKVIVSRDLEFVHIVNFKSVKNYLFEYTYPSILSFNDYSHSLSFSLLHLLLFCFSALK